MPPTAANPVHACVAFLRIPGFDARPAAEQASLKEKLETRALAALARVPASERIVLDAGDGLALVLFGDAERALDIAQQVQREPDGLPLQAGVAYGPLALTHAGAEPRVFGDGLGGAAAAAGFAEPARMLVTDGFAKLLQATSPDRARELRDAGDFTDTRVRIHRFYAPDPELRAVRRRRIALYAVSGVVAILLIGVIGRDVYQPLFQSRPAIVKIEVKPRGELFVDGVSQGRTPPLTELRIPPGKHKLSIRNPGYRPVELNLDLKPGQKTTVTQTLQRIPDPPKPDLWRDLKKRFGS
ncbi:MAG TPA: PEGA domain-containing protein [Usitatibacter sp.]|nr:PEGA domain-containing protein [Usitatibacter sp.]